MIYLVLGQAATQRCSASCSSLRCSMSPVAWTMGLLLAGLVSWVPVRVRQAAAAASYTPHAAWRLSRTEDRTWAPGHDRRRACGSLRPTGPAPPRIHDRRGREEADTARRRDPERPRRRAAAGGRDAVCPSACRRPIHLYWAATGAAAQAAPVADPPLTIEDVGPSGTRRKRVSHASESPSLRKIQRLWI
jgi:hypothetical protein